MSNHRTYTSYNELYAKTTSGLLNLPRIISAKRGGRERAASSLLMKLNAISDYTAERISPGRN